MYIRNSGMSLFFNFPPSSYFLGVGVGRYAFIVYVEKNSSNWAQKWGDKMTVWRVGWELFDNIKV